MRNDNKEDLTNKSSAINKSSITHRNRDVIANCLGMESSRVLRRDKKNNSHSISNLELKREINIITHRGSHSNKINEEKNYVKPKNHSKKKIEENEGNKSTRNNSKKQENNNNCFIIFNKSNIKNLKKEIQRYDSKNATIETEPLNGSYIDERKKYLIRPNTENKEIQSNHFKTYKNINSTYNTKEDFNSSPFAKGNKNDFSQADISSKNRFLLSSPERNESIQGFEDRKLNKNIINLAESKTKLEKGIIILFNHQMIS